MSTPCRIVSLAAAIFLCNFFASTGFAGQVDVRYPEGSAHGLFLIRSMDNKEIGNGDLVETLEDGHVKSVFVLTFKDGSIYQETSLFEQHQQFKLLNYQLTQKGPMFKQDIEMTIDVGARSVSVQSMENGKTKKWNEHMDMPADLANGIVPYLVRNMAANSRGATVSMIAASPKPRLVHLLITPRAEETFPFDGSKMRATRYRIHPDVSGVTGSLAKITGKQPPNSFLWMLSDKVPTFLMAQEAFEDGPTCRIELATPIPTHGVDDKSGD
jgi:hypothetical protein